MENGDIFSSHQLLAIDQLAEQQSEVKTESLGKPVLQPALHLTTRSVFQLTDKKH